MNQDQRNSSYQASQPGSPYGYPPQNSGYPYNPPNPQQAFSTGGYNPSSPQQGFSAGGYQNQGAQGNPGFTGAGQTYSTPGYPPSGYGTQGYSNAGYSAQGQGYAGSGYTGQGQGYAGPGYTGQAQNYVGTGYTGQAQSYGGQGYDPQNQGYAGQAFQAQGQSYAQPPQPYPATYPQGGYTSSAYGGAQPPNSYPQMGRQTDNRNPVGQMPINGGGYVPQPVKVKRMPFAFNDTLLIAIGGFLAALLAVSLFVPGLSVLKWIFLALTAGMIALMWIRPITANNKRLCFTIVFAALSAVAVISALNLGGGTADPQNPGKTGTVSTSGQNTAASPAGAVLAVNPTVAPAEETPEPDTGSDVTTRLYQFFQYWSANQTEEMLSLCSPSWQSKTDNPKAELFGLLANRTPLDYNFENVSGTNSDQSRTVTLNTLIDRNNGKDPSRYRLNVIMVKDGDTWYVNPQSLQTYEAADTPDPNVTPTPAPTEEMHADANTVLYYNPDGGTKYHLDPNCKSTHQKYLPFKGHFTYSEINKSEYVKLSPCNVCGAPLRP